MEHQKAGSQYVTGWRSETEEDPKKERTEFNTVANTVQNN